MSAPIKKNDRQTVYIEDLTHDGNGVAKIDGYPLFIQGALPGETAEIHVMKTLKNYGFAKVMNILEKSPDRVEAPCVYFSQCGGCQLQHLSYEGQLKWKQNMVANVMKRLGKIDAPVHPVKGMEEPWHYRNKSQIPFAQNESGQMVAGFYKTKSHSIVDMERCLIQTGEADVVMADLKRELEILGVRPYDEKSHQGMLRHVVVRKGRATGEVMVVLVTKSKKFPQASAVIERIRALIPNVTSIVQNVNGEKTNVIFGNDTFTLWGKDTIEDTIGNVRFEISARSFYQVNPVQTEVLYKQALDYAQLTGNERVIDAYCGIGSISLFLAQKAGHVMGVEIVEQAIEDAKRNAALNGFTNTYFEAGPAEEVIPRWYKEGKEADVLVVDPPRKGCDEALLNTIIEQKPKRVVYVSCNPATLARDLRILEDGGYKTQEVQPVDMFPHTTHCEAVAWLELAE
ncbi:23S rRNA (uracil1939-C5)-methyltransferase [Solibacillus kalamii]|uniref:23S rRNA (Uracil(1939)-C(5))-methyltransferase RlmD n=1 Tax=Solibacillus kalamii TaxID=1748298 RepID=A0ABX3ZHN0_9BACL|nr:23S rRNA (uracil(1939)-C(5))-methyltransferase RlmD [Solibacillus kalamii]MBM7665614.1 23S rRNA (uracil1939-C5)-methyltransferase [Solibacillus kalamii]OUZ38939.1 23S rRNA (uracil(1939)-C(5))-methyltransferase RlmD [Solibacillus kalamii]